MKYYDVSPKREDPKWKSLYESSSPETQRTMKNCLEEEEVRIRNAQGIWDRQDEGREIKYLGSDNQVYQVRIMGINNSRHLNLASEVVVASEDLNVGGRSYLNLPRSFEKIDGNLSKPREWFFVGKN